MVAGPLGLANTKPGAPVKVHKRRNQVHGVLADDDLTTLLEEIEQVVCHAISFEASTWKRRPSGTEAA